MFGLVSNAQLEVLNNYFKQFVKLVQYKRNKIEYIEIFYNMQRLHSYNNYMSPLEFEEKMLHLEMAS